MIGKSFHDFILAIACLSFMASGLLISAAVRANQYAAPSSVLEGNIDSFSLHITYNGPQEKPFYNLTLSVAATQKAADAGFDLHAQITPAQARKLISVLAANNDLNMRPAQHHVAIMAPANGQAVGQVGVAIGDSNDAPPDADAAPPNGYNLVARTEGNGKGNGTGTGTGAAEYPSSLGFDLRTLVHLDALRACLDGDSAKAMDQLLDRLSGLRKQWIAEGRVFDLNGLAVFIKPPAAFAPGTPVIFDVTLANESDKAFTLTSNPSNIDCWNLNITAETGQPKYTISRKGRTGMADPGRPLVIDAHQKVNVKLSLADCQYYEVPTKFPAKMVPLASLPPGKYSMEFNIQFGPQAQPLEESHFPNPWQGQINSAAVEFEVK